MDINEKIFELEKTGEYTHAEIAEIVNRLYGENLSADAIRKRYYRFRDNIGQNFDTSPHVNTTVNLNAGSKNTIFEDYLRELGLDPTEYDVKRGSVWGNPAQVAVKIERKPLEPEVLYRNVLNLLENHKTHDTSKVVPKADLAVLGIADAHVGKLAFEKNQKPEDVYLEIIRKFVERLGNEKPETVLYVVGNDLFHYDNRFYQTTKGTSLVPDKNWTENLPLVFDLIYQSVEMLKTICNQLVVVFTPGNHDQYSLTFLATAFSKLYNDSKVKIYPPFPVRAYMKFGHIGLMFDHGTKGKRNLDRLFSKENPRLWGEVKSRFALIGHLHTFAIEQVGGLTVIQMPALSQTDEWHYENGFVDAEQGAVIVTFERNKLSGVHPVWVD